ncbi:unnamed protein product [Rotaria sordida]|uniref:Uncharacterized protein n=1 Tax=Rotaria sordida TaxID=392033 RepID=A0A814APW5_9BILA|nr:unnamed protein product [Rotaria sordida]CAF0934872.1 unnamed protein product [Rotaria sordida]CAF3836257.1 unnamed protein product [Rotaria sordida]CAF4004797.1 unnamed protein product [Rotaria sordida]
MLVAGLLTIGNIRRSQQVGPTSIATTGTTRARIRKDERKRGFIRRYFSRCASVDEPLSDEHTMVMVINSDKLKQYVESKPLPAEIKRYVKSNTII